MKLLDSIPFTTILILGVFLALAPIYPQPHLMQKIQMLINGALVKPLDIFDLFFHSFGLVLVVLKVFRLRQLKNP